MKNNKIIYYNKIFFILVCAELILADIYIGMYAAKNVWVNSGPFIKAVGSIVCLMIGVAYYVSDRIKKKIEKEEPIFTIYQWILLVIKIMISCAFLLICINMIFNYNFRTFINDFIVKMCL